jgi:hypothetical protein
MSLAIRLSSEPGEHMARVSATLQSEILTSRGFFSSFTANSRHAAPSAQMEDFKRQKTHGPIPSRAQ